MWASGLIGTPRQRLFQLLFVTGSTPYQFIIEINLELRLNRQESDGEGVYSRFSTADATSSLRIPNSMPPLS